MSIPFAYVTFCDEQPGGGRWDQAHLHRLLTGQDWLVPGGHRFVEVTQEELFERREGVAVMPTGHYLEHCGTGGAMRDLATMIRDFRWLVIIATSDEASNFPWHKVYIPKTHRLWVMTPRVDQRYPDGTRFIGDFSPVAAKDIYAESAGERDLDVFFSGQINHSRRVEMWEAVAPLRDDPVRWVKAEATGGFTQGMEQDEYLFNMTRAWFVPCPSGVRCQDSFRFYEALEAGCIPIADELRPDGGGYGYWRMIFGDRWDVLGDDLVDWEVFPQIAEVDRYVPFMAAITTAEWTQYKRQVAYELDSDVASIATPEERPASPDDLITVIIPTSPVPSNPDIDMIQATIASVRERLPHSEILIGCDGVHPDQDDRREQYDVFLQRLTFWANAQQNIVPFIMGGHRHQSGIMHELLPEVRTPFVLFVEQDTPLEGDIPFRECVGMMIDDELAMLRFSHEAGVLPGHEHLFLETEPGDKPYVRTIQFSARPHLAWTKWYRDLVQTYWAPSATTFIEDVLHGVMQTGVTITDGTDRAFTDGKQVLRAWERNRLAVYAPEGTWKRSGHLDGRAGDPKFPQHYHYTGPRPPGAPGEGPL